MIDTVVEVPISAEVVQKYFKSLINCFFKILPIWESGEKTLPTYIYSLQTELLGCKEFICELGNDPSFLTLLSILQYLHDTPDCPIPEVKRLVFRSIAICNKMSEQHSKAV